MRENGYRAPRLYDWQQNGLRELSRNERDLDSFFFFVLFARAGYAKRLVDRLLRDVR